jgi:hypothetical protein
VVEPNAKGVHVHPKGDDNSGPETIGRARKSWWMQILTRFPVCWIYQPPKYRYMPCGEQKIGSCTSLLHDGSDKSIVYEDAAWVTITKKNQF